MGLAMGAVACLSSVILQWSTHFPAERASLQHSLFGDLVEENAPLQDGLLTPSPVQMADVPSFQNSPASVLTPASGGGDNRIDGNTAFRGRRLPPAPGVRFTEPLPSTVPAPAETDDVQTVSHLSRSETNAGWFSGTIDQDPHDDQPPVRSSGKIVQLGHIILDE